MLGYGRGLSVFVRSISGLLSRAFAALYTRSTTSEVSANSDKTSLLSLVLLKVVLQIVPEFEEFRKL